jgi:hypothetical protein
MRSTWTISCSIADWIAAVRACSAFAGSVRRDGDRLAERDQDAPAEPLAGLETEPYRHD